MKKFFSEKKNIVMVSLIGAALLLILIASFWTIISPLAFVVSGAACIDVAYILFLRYVKNKNNKVEEFMQDEGKLKKGTAKFLRSEGRMNLTLLIIMFFVMGVVLIYYAIKTIGV